MRVARMNANGVSAGMSRLLNMFFACTTTEAPTPRLRCRRGQPRTPRLRSSEVDLAAAAWGRQHA